MTQSRAYKGVAPADRIAARREALIEAGLDSLHEDGLSGVSVRSICTRARLTPRYFYESFADLDALLVGVVNAVCADVAAHALEAVARAGDDLESEVRAAVTSAHAVLHDDPRKATAFLVASAGPEGLVNSREQWLTEFVQLVLTNLPVGGAQTVPGRKHAKAAALFVMGGTAELFRAVFSGSLRLSQPELVDQLTEMWVAVLAG